jgi:DNA-directed RNA polymerase subunit RPC12/RpoP
MKPIRHCIDCGIPLHKKSQYRKAGASTRCRPCYWKHMKKPEKLCVDCGKILPRRKATRCLVCNGLHNRKPLRKCVDCGKELNVNSRYTKTQRCQQCHGKDMLGFRHPNWNGGSTPMRKRVQNSAEYKTWRSSVFEADDYTCCVCDRRGKHLHAHHILSFSEYPSLRTTISNGATLCVSCHRKLHSEIRRAS